jgi:hypothetical protein
MKQTSIEWLVDQLKKYDLSRDNILIVIPLFIWKEKVEKAKEIEKQEIIETFKYAQVLHTMNDQTRGEQYYTEKYKSE